MINLGIVDDQSIITSGLQMVLSQFKDINVIATAANGEEALGICNAYAIDVLLMDIKMPKLNGIEAIELIKAKHPQIQIIIFTTFKDEEFITKGLSKGASGYILKDASPQEIYDTVLKTVQGGAVIDPLVAKTLISSLKNTKSSNHPIENILTQREQEIALLVAKGYNNKEISNTIHLSEGTIKNHLSNIYEKLNLRDRTQLAIYVHEN